MTAPRSPEYVVGSALFGLGAPFKKKDAQYLLDALKAAGYKVVAVPREEDLRHGFALEVRRGQILDHGPLDAFSPQDAREFAGALLAAADAAEAVS